MVVKPCNAYFMKTKPANQETDDIRGSTIELANVKRMPGA
jgi:hypothetical protein